ncbi:MAG: RNA-directed DNA polymerase [Gemmatimonadetes bacterium]|nr:RNA-directed DNA polymerase [Gemmatimonadota bacterium]
MTTDPSAPLSIPDADYTYRSLLRNNYLPARAWHRDEVPPFFSTRTLTPEKANELLGVTDKKRSHDFIHYRLTRHANSTRLLSIPHPAPYARLCREIFDSWDIDMVFRIEQNKESRIVPRVYPNDNIVSFGSYEASDGEEDEDSRVIMQHHPASASRLRAEEVDLAIGKRYLVKADIAAFFPSVYTHAIPWAVHGKEVGKQWPPDYTLCGNRLDRCSRNLQRRESIGVPIGPGTSHILSELLLNPVDAYLREQGYAFIRLIDDYRCYCASRKHADAFIIDLEDQLTEYGLHLNASKTSIASLPVKRNDPWAVQLRTQLSEMELSKTTTVSDVFDLAIGLQAKWPESNVLKYAARALARKSESAGDLLERTARHILGIAFHHPTVTPILAGLVQKSRAAVRVAEVEQLLCTQLKERLPSDAICWTLFLWQQLAGTRRTLPSELVDRVIEQADCMVISSLWAIGQGRDQVIRFVERLDPGDRGWQYDRYWLLVHEVADAVPQTTQYRKETGLQFLADKQVAFIDRTVLYANEFEEVM